MVVRDNYTFSELENWLNERASPRSSAWCPTDRRGPRQDPAAPEVHEDRGMRLPEWWWRWA